MMKPFFKFNRECQNEALRKYGKRFADLTDEQCAEITKIVSRKKEDYDTANSRRKKDTDDMRGV